MDFASMLTKETYLLVVILFVLMMILRSNKKIENWTIQWIILVVALGLSYIEKGAFNIDTILNAFVATGVCLFGENAMFRKEFEKTTDDIQALKLLEGCKQNLDKSIDKSSLEFTQEEIDNIMSKAIEEKITKSTQCSCENEVKSK